MFGPHSPLYTPTWRASTDGGTLAGDQGTGRNQERSRNGLPPRGGVAHKLVTTRLEPGGEVASRGQRRQTPRFEQGRGVAIGNPPDRGRIDASRLERGGEHASERTWRAGQTNVRAPQRGDARRRGTLQTKDG